MIYTSALNESKLHTVGGKQYSMRVLHLIASMDPKTGGPCQGIRLSAPTLETLDVYREVACCDDPSADYLGKDSFPVYALGGHDNPWCYSPNLLPWLNDNLHRFDAVVSNGLWLYHTQAIRKALRAYRQRTGRSIRWYVMPHGMLDPYFQKAPERRLKAVRNWLYWKLFEEKTIRESDGILFTCETELQLARTTFSPYRPKQELNIGYGVAEPPVYEPAMKAAFLERCPAVADQPYLLFLSRIHLKKGADLLLKAYQQYIKLMGEAVESVPHLVIAGPGLDTPYGRALEQTVADDPRLQGRVHFPGMLGGHAKWGAFYGCDAFALPSHQENFGIAVAEALACGKPVLISNQVNIWQEIVAGGGGLVADDTLAGTVQLLTQWMTLPREQQRLMGRQAQAVYNEHYLIEKAAIRFKAAVK